MSTARSQDDVRLIPETYPFRNLSKKVQRRALAEAIATRKFEIELYWKRATYFWAAIATTFVGYFATIGTFASGYRSTAESPLDAVVRLLPGLVPNGERTLEASLLLALSGAGVTFSLAWYMVNRASSRWQRNWEMHIRYLEPCLLGPLYATKVSAETYRDDRLVDPYDFSITRISAALSLGVAFVWVFLWAMALVTVAGAKVPPGAIALLGFSFMVVWLIGLWTASRQPPEGPEPTLETKRYVWSARAENDSSRRNVTGPLS